MAERNCVYPYIPNSAPHNREALKKELGIVDEMELYSEIPEDLQYRKRLRIPEALGDEYSIRKHVSDLLRKNYNTEEYTCYLGAGCAKHYTPAVCDEIIGRGEFLTAYFGNTTDDRGKWQAIWEYQAQMSELLDVEYVGFPEYDGPWALSHAMLMCTRMTERQKILVPASISPMNLAIAQNYADGVGSRQADIEKVAYDATTGLLDLDDLKRKLDDTVAAVVIENPTFLGILETQAEEIGKMARAVGAEFVVYADPISLGVVEAPANYGATISCGDIHSLGCHVAAGGQQGGYLGIPAEPRYMSQCKDLAVSVAPTIEDGEYAFVFHNFLEGSYVTRDKANEFTGTASNLWAIHAAVYMASMGPQGMQEVGRTIMKRAQYGAKALSGIPGAKLAFSGPYFKEVVVNFDGAGKKIADINKKLLDHKILGGYDLSTDFPELGQSAMYCFTELTTQAEIDALAAALREIVAR